MQTHACLALLGGLSPAQFMRRHWQKRPLLVRQALPGVTPPLARAELFALAASSDVESRLVVREGDAWSVRSGPLARRSLPALTRENWTLLVQGLDLHVDAAQQLLTHFRFLPQARLDDLMMSWASHGGGVGPHLDSYDVFLLQVQGQRRWRVSAASDPRFIPDLPLKILSHFKPQQEWLLEPGDMLYLPPGWAHDGTAIGECMTCSIGFRAPAAAALAGEILARLSDEAGADEASTIYRDPAQAATARPGAIPPRLQAWAQRAVQHVMRQPQALQRALGEVLTEPKPRVWFASPETVDHADGVRLAKGSRMMYDEHHVFLNGEAFLARGRDAGRMRTLADTRHLGAAQCQALSAPAHELLLAWLAQGWLEPETG